MTPTNWISIAGIGVVVILAVYAFVYRLDRRVGVVEGRCSNHQKVIDSIETLNSRLDKVQNDNDVFWKIIGPHLEGIIHSPKSVDRDALVRKLVAGDITKDELPCLIEMLYKSIGGTEWNYEKKFAGVLLLAHATALFNDATYERRRPT